MNEIINKFLLAGDTFMPKIHLRQDTALSKPEFIYSGCVPFTKNNQRIQKVKETRDSRHIYQSELDYALSTRYDHFKYLPRRTASDKVLRNKAFNIAKNPN